MPSPGLFLLEVLLSIVGLLTVVGLILALIALVAVVVRRRKR